MKLLLILLLVVGIACIGIGAYPYVKSKTAPHTSSATPTLPSITPQPDNPWVLRCRLPEREESIIEQLTETTWRLRYAPGERPYDVSVRIPSGYRATLTMKDNNFYPWAKYPQDRPDALGKVDPQKPCFNMSLLGMAWDSLPKETARAWRPVKYEDKPPMAVVVIPDGQVPLMFSAATNSVTFSNNELHPLRWQLDVNDHLPPGKSIGDNAWSHGGSYTFLLTIQDRSQTSGATARATRGQFQVDAASSKGFLFENPQREVIVVKFVASGQWSFWPEQGEHSADGNPRYAVASVSGPNYKLPTAPLGSLIVRRGDGTYEFVGSERTIWLQPNERLFFVMNDSVNYGKDYADNRGIITVEWTCSDCGH